MNTWVARFIHNCRGRQKLSGPLSKSEIDNVKRRWIVLVQQRDKLQPHFEQRQKALNLQTNASGLLVCHGRIQAKYPVYLPIKAVLTRKLVQKLHCETLHCGVGLTMAAVREQYWVPKLRSLVKSVRSECYGCRRFTATPITAPQHQDHSPKIALALKRHLKLLGWISLDPSGTNKARRVRRRPI